MRTSLTMMLATTLLAGCGSDLVHGSCNSASDGFCDEVAFSHATLGTTQAMDLTDHGACPYLASQSPSGIFPAWSEGGHCPSGALGGCACAIFSTTDAPCDKDGEEVTRFYYPSATVTSSDDVRARCGTHAFVNAP